ncbi:MAG: alpha-ketoglutarate-dependent dioxygenase AlkB [Candidatus Sulfotelmatobacter sp.]
MNLPPGLSSIGEFLPSDEQSSLLKKIRELHFTHDRFRGRRLKRCYAQYGYAYVSTGKKQVPAAPFPVFLSYLTEKASPNTPAGTLFNQCIITHYPKTAGIGWHKDADLFPGCIIAVSLADTARLQFDPTELSVRRMSCSLLGRQDGRTNIESLLSNPTATPSRFATLQTEGPLPADLLVIPGFAHHENSITFAEEADLLSHISANSARWEKDYSRRAQRYGGRYIYGEGKVELLGPLPRWLVAWAERLCDAGWMHTLADQVTVQEYAPGAGISPHIDEACFGPEIVTLSLLSSCVYQLLDPRTKVKFERLILPRSGVILSGEARKIWKHGIPARKSDDIAGRRLLRRLRFSITFRTINPAGVASQ